MEPQEIFDSNDHGKSYATKSRAKKVIENAIKNYGGPDGQVVSYLIQGYEVNGTMRFRPVGLGDRAFFLLHLGFCIA